MNEHVLDTAVTRRTALKLGIGAALISMGGGLACLQPETAYAASVADDVTSAHMEGGPMLFYFDEKYVLASGKQAIGTRERYATVKGHKLTAFCINPSKNGFADVTLPVYPATSAFNATAVEECRILCWFAPGQPGYDSSLWPLNAPNRNTYHWRDPASGIYGHPQTMSDWQYQYCMSHVALAWVLGGRNTSLDPYVGLSSDSISWFQSAVCSAASTATFGRALARKNEVPSTLSYDLMIMNPDHSYRPADDAIDETQTMLIPVYQNTGYFRLEKGAEHTSWR